MRKNRVIEQNRCYHLVSRLAHRAFFLDDEEKDRAVALMRRVEAGVKASMSYCINRTVSISSDPFAPLRHLQLEEMAEHRELAPGVVRVTYGNGDRIYVNHTQAAASPDGVSVPAQDFVFLPAR